MCVGNIYLGGTGKTPLVYEIYNILNSIGKNPAIIKKYYNYLEDEISLLKSKSIVFSEKNRSLAIKELIENKYDTAIMDDGFQDSNKKIIAFAGIGNPINFFELIKDNNLNLIDYRSFPDHYNFSEKDLNDLLLKAKNNDAILLTTEKDYFRINNSFKNSIEKLEVKLEIENKDNFIKLLKENL